MSAAKAKGPQDMTAPGQAQNPDGIADENAAQLARGVPITILGQYVKDISFENPGAPEVLFLRDGQPAMDISFSMGVKGIENDTGKELFEVTLGVTATARRAEKIAYIAEIEYAVLVALNNVAKERQHPTLLIKIPEFAFPFVRQILANLTQQGGFMPLLLAPVDFRGMYIERFGEGSAPQPAAATA
jgi:preprotein translocase subunit SecB